MKTFLQQYESQTRYLLLASIGLVGLGVYAYLSWSPLGALLSIIGAVGLVWCFLRR